MIKEYIRVLKARGWMKRNMSFLYSWHAYVGYELDLYDAFRKPATIEEVASARSLKEDMLKRWVEVGMAIRYIKQTSKGHFKTIKSFMLPSSKKNPRSTGVILKEMMELHIPTLLSYPDMMKTKEKKVFNHQIHGTLVAQTSSLLEQLALPALSRFIKKHNVQSIVDIGCGHAGYLQRLSQEYPAIRMTGIELNKEVAKEAAHRCESYPNITIECQDAKSWKPDGQADLIMVNNLLHYISPEERQPLFQQLKNSLGETGSISVMTPIHNSKHGKQFSSVFNSFFSAFNNLYPVPTEKDLYEIAAGTGLNIKEFKPVVKEGGWYRILMQK